jgi:hypothetical protein
MRVGAVIVLLGLTAIVAYSLGRQDAPTARQSSAVTVTSPTGFDGPVALTRKSSGNGPRSRLETALLGDTIVSLP